ncbi:NADase-type glycan-binding domain-containing protein [Leptospira alstonii]|uniref:NADase-type glycan-binding domain-containing protein n=1 Tax=Leptospira alstonii TaxID=28452 RepID=UPI000772DBDD|nr:hypothetical protein [Leptospira alstonii]
MKKNFILVSVVLFSIHLKADSVIYTFLSVHKVKANSSSHLAESNKPKEFYNPIKAMDRNVETAWCEGKDDDGVHESIEFILPPTKTIGFTLLNGFGKFKEKYQKNNRVKTAKISILTENGQKKEFTHTFADGTCGFMSAGGKVENYKDYCSDHSGNKSKMKACKEEFENQCIMDEYEGGGERVFFKDRIQIVYFRLEILSTYKGSQYNDTCISEINFMEVNSGDFGADYFKTDNSIQNRY